MSKMDHAPILTPANRGQGGSGAGTVQLTSAGTSVASAMPTASDTNRAKYIRIATTGTGYVRMNNATTVAVVTDVLFTSGWVEVWPTGDATHIAFISDSGTVKCNVTAVEYG
jgi:hypothetical protein